MYIRQVSELIYYATEDNSEFSEGKGKGERRENSKERTHHIMQ
jgi:hypothetical protein